MSIKKNLLCAASLLVLLTACGKEKSASKGGAEKAEKEEKTLVATIAAKPKNLDPTVNSELVSYMLAAQMYDTLFKLDEKGEVIPDVAESYEYVTPTKLKIKIKPGIKFHNGDELKASDAAFTINRMKEMAGSKISVEAVKKATALNDYELEVELNKPSAPLLYNLAAEQASLLNEKYTAKSKDITSVAPMGTGPFKFVDWGNGEKIEFAGNKEYFAGAPKLDKLIFKVIGEDSSRIAALETGEVDFANPVAPIDVQIVEDNKDLYSLSFPTTSTEYVGINNQRAPFTNKKLRQAIHRAIDKQSILDAIYLGKGKVAGSIVSQSAFGYDESNHKLTYDLDAAKKLLKESGVENLKLTITSNDNPVRVQAAQIIQANLKELGIDATIEILEWGTYLQATSQGNYDIFLGGWVLSNPDPDATIFKLLHTSAMGSPGNKAHYSNPEYDKLADAGRVELDVAKRREIYKKAQEILAEDSPLVPLYYKNENLGLNKKVKGFKPSNNLVHEFASVDIVEE